MTLVYLDENPDWEPWSAAFEGHEQWEEYEPDEPERQPRGGCDYCGTFEDLRENPEPFGGRVCCEGCFLVILGDDEDAPFWRCGEVKFVGQLRRGEPT